MGDLKPEIDEKTYLAGIPLSEAAFKFGNPQLVKEYSTGTSPEFSKISSSSNTNSFLNILATATQNIQNLHDNQNRQKNILESLHKDILLLIKNGDLIPYCYQSPRNLSDMPKRIPIDIILSGQLNWANSELIYKNFEFTGIRLINALKEIAEINLANNNPIPEMPNNSKNNKSSKSPNLPQKNISDLAPDQFIDEKLAAEYLGISPRTLQGYRTKGGGPEFHKISHKVVRYKINELINWASNRKKKNTSGAL